MTTHAKPSPTSRRDPLDGARRTPCEKPSEAEYNEERDELTREMRRLELAYPRFTAEQRSRLRKRGLVAEQVERLEELLPSLKSPHPRPRMQDVRDQLDDLAKAAQRLQKRYARLSASKTPASDQARTRLQFAQEHLGYPDWSTLERYIDTVARIATTARDGASGETRRSIYRNPIGQIIATLAPARFEVTRKRQPFLEIAQIVSAASGAWGVDDAIRAYLTPEGGNT